MSAEPDPQAEPLVPVFVTTAVRTSAGSTPGPKMLPPAEAARLISAKLAVGDTTAPRGYDDGGAPPRPEPNMMPRSG